MKKYIETKQIEAEPMTLGDFVQETGRNPYGKDIKGFKAFSDLAMTFFPEYSNIDAASKRMRAEIENDESLFNALKQAHYTHNTTRLSPNQQYILISLRG